MEGLTGRGMIRVMGGGVVGQFNGGIREVSGQLGAGMGGEVGGWCDERMSERQWVE